MVLAFLRVIPSRRRRASLPRAGGYKRAVPDLRGRQMPLILIAGVVATNPKSDPFPTNGRPRCKINVRVEGSDAALYRIVAFDEPDAQNDGSADLVHKREQPR